jgi:hypothetical protein
MRNFFSHWKILLALILLIVLAVITVTPGDARADPPLARPATGTEIRFVFFVNEALPWPGSQDRANFIAFTLAARAGSADGSCTLHG